MLSVVLSAVTQWATPALVTITGILLFLLKSRANTIVKLQEQLLQSKDAAQLAPLDSQLTSSEAKANADEKALNSALTSVEVHKS